MTQLTKEQRSFLEEQRKKYLELRQVVVEKYTPAIFENIKGIRETIRNLSITSGAIGALTLSIINKDIVQTKLILIIALAIFLLVVWEGFFYLKYILEKENNQLSQRVYDLHKAITSVRNQIDKALKEDSHEEALKFFDVSKEMEKIIYEDKKIDNWFVKNIGDLTFVPFTIAILLVVLSFINFDFFYRSLKIIFQ